jgi:hypothetical protein
MEELVLLQQKLTSLLKQYSALKADHAALQQSISRQAGVIMDLNREKEDLEKELALAGIRKSGDQLDPEQKLQLKARLDKVLDALNKNIDLL